MLITQPKYDEAAINKLFEEYFGELPETVEEVTERRREDLEALEAEGQPEESEDKPEEEFEEGKIILESELVDEPEPKSFEDLDRFLETATEEELNKFLETATQEELAYIEGYSAPVKDVEKFLETGTDEDIEYKEPTKEEVAAFSKVIQPSTSEISGAGLRSKRSRIQKGAQQWLAKNKGKTLDDMPKSVIKKLLML